MVCFIRFLSSSMTKASQRYSSSVGMCPKLSLKTEHGASLCPDDFVSDVLLDNEKVVAVVNGWDAGSVCENYQRECAVLGIGKSTCSMLKQYSIPARITSHY